MIDRVALAKAIWLAGTRKLGRRGSPTWEKLEHRYQEANLAAADAAEAFFAALASAPQPSELVHVREEIRLVTEILRAFPDDVAATCSAGDECSEQFCRFLTLLAHERELMAAQPAPEAPTTVDVDELKRLRALRFDALTGLGGEAGLDAGDSDIVEACVEWAASVRRIPEELLDPEVGTLQEAVEKLLADRDVQPTADALAKAQVKAFEEAAQVAYGYCDTKLTTVDMRRAATKVGDDILALAKAVRT